MRRLSLRLFIAAAVLTVAASCAKREDTDTSALETRAFNAWAEKHLNVGVDVAKQENGMYIEFLNDITDEEKLAPADTVVWVKINYTATTLSDDVFVTRSEGEALKQGTYTMFTYYTPDYVFCGNENHSMMKGQYFALKKELLKPDGSTTVLREGSKVRMYMPSSLAMGSGGYSDDQGYGGQFSLSGDVPIIEELEIVKVIKNPIKYEEDLVKAMAQSPIAEGGWNLTNEQTDTIAPLLFIDTVSFKLRPDYNKYTNFKPDLGFKKEYLLTADSTAKIWFVGKFLDGFIFDTNIDDFYTEFHSRTPGYTPKSKSHSVLSYTPEEDKDTYISAFYQAIPAMCRGQWYRIIFPSSYGYGSTGLSAALKAEEEYYNYYMSYMMSSYYYNNSSYGNSYYDSYSYNPYYSNYDYLNYSTSSETEIITEIQPYTPLIFEIYIEPDEE